MAHLYVNSKGFEVRSHSYSAGSLFRECAQKYKLQRLDGWKEREQRASMEFGKAIETAIQAYHARHSLDEALIVFRNFWETLKTADLKYAPVEKDWQSLALSGEEMIKLYHLRLPLLPFDLSVAPEFQIKYYKEMFPGSDLAGIEFVAYIDMRVNSKLTLGDALGVDIKVMNKALDTTPDIARLDQQLRTYAWVTGIPDWAFLNFIKQGRELERGSHVALLGGVGKFTAGQSAVVIKFQEYEPAKPADPAKPRSKPKEEISEETWIVESADVIDRMFETCGKGQTNDEKDARNFFIRDNATKINRKLLTKQKIQFVNTHIGLNEQLEAARQIGQDVAQIVYADQENFYPKQGGIRWPNDKCVHCSMRGICLDNSELRDKLVYRTDEDWDARQEETQE